MIDLSKYYVGLDYCTLHVLWEYVRYLKMHGANVYDQKFKNFITVIRIESKLILPNECVLRN